MEPFDARFVGWNQGAVSVAAGVMPLFGLERDFRPFRIPTLGFLKLVFKARIERVTGTWQLISALATLFGIRLNCR